MIQTYEVGGKGRKPCPHCNKYVAARVLVCACGYSFQEGIVMGKSSEVKAESDPRRTVGGKGLRQCSGCKLYISIKKQVCVCGHIFEKVIKEVQDIPTFTEGGRGRKLCGGCGAYVGARVLVCGCGHSFHAVSAVVDVPVATVAKPVEVVKSPVVERDGKGTRYRVVAIPAGRCPIKLTSTAQDVVLAWAQGLLDYGRSHFYNYSTSALRYWVRDYYEIGSSEYREVCEVLGEMFLQQSA